MAYTVYAGLDPSKLSTVSLVFDAGGSKTATITATCCHLDLQSVMGSGNYDDVAAVLKTAMDAQGGGPYTITFDQADLSYKLTRTGGAWSLTSGTTAPMRQLLGTGATFPIASVDISGVHTINLDIDVTSSAVRPYYLIRGALGAASHVSREYEPEGRVAVGEATDGTISSTSPDTVPIYSDVTLEFEPKAAVFTEDATAAVPFTWQHFFAHVRSEHPWVGDDDTKEFVRILRAEGAHFAPVQIQDDWEQYWHIRLYAYQKGKLP